MLLDLDNTLMLTIFFKKLGLLQSDLYNYIAGNKSLIFTSMPDAARIHFCMHFSLVVFYEAILSRSINIFWESRPSTFYRCVMTQEVMLTRLPDIKSRIFPDASGNTFSLLKSSVHQTKCKLSQNERFHWTCSGLKICIFFEF